MILLPESEYSNKWWVRKSSVYYYRYAPIMIMLMYTGLRVGEALALTWDDINFKEKLIEVNKSIIYIPV